ncbi:DNA-directed RNA polymerase sigma-70 factor [Luteitalea sp. TBR-22]|uniref:sigma-70 family RNA polymerase sigma factor n=1 Tax=Luteitalea sp. TBR-22 TaxID=2802971 RepID=UPI001AFC256A|nr:sigma-70 family RNA polymerase sigma factor [Luteitalea sp. TBR-22]BCS31197.1 DNA-directed RNA polymerase sigma-70 factor [Luteitalea sp. TBR-22]
MADTPGSPGASGSSSGFTWLLQRWSGGDAAALDALMPAVHAELRRLARSYMRREREGHTLEPTALVHEAYLRLVDQQHVRWQSRGHFFAIAAQAMRRVLVDHARAHVADKRGGGAERVTISGLPADGASQDLDVLWLHEALEALARLDARQARVVELRYFAGMTVEEVAAATDTSPATVKRDWDSARRFLAVHLTRRSAQ